MHIMSRESDFPRMVAFGGQLDKFFASFMEWLGARSPAESQFIGLSPVALRMDVPISWRQGSMVSENDTVAMLKDADAFVYFGLMPITEDLTDEGLAEDVALCGAYNLAQAAARNPSCHVILVMRAFPRENRKFGKYYQFWREIIRIFQKNCRNLTILETTPILSELDSLTLGMAERVLAEGKSKNHLTPEWLNFTSLTHPETLYSAIFHALTHVFGEPERHVIADKNLVTYDEWYRMLKDVVSGHFRAFPQLMMHIHPEASTRQILVGETLKFSTTHPDWVGDNLSEIGIEEGCRERLRGELKNMVNRMGWGRSLCLKALGRAGKGVQSRCYVQRILSAPNRDIPAITDLLMKWIPRYFQRTVRVDDLDENRRICRLARIPLMELEKKQETPTRCQLILRTPWGKSVKPVTRFTVTQTGTIEDSGELLVIVEDGPSSGALMKVIRAMLWAFGKYLRDYGVGK